MATNEEILTPQSLIIAPLTLANQASTKAASLGMLAVSGANLLFYNGSAWRDVTNSAVT